MSDLAALERLKGRYGAEAAARKLQRLRKLDRQRLRSARAVRRLHELLCFLRAFPDDAAVAAQVERMIGRFGRRADLRAFRAELAHTGIAGTTIWFPFFWPTARWLAGQWPSLLRFDRNDTLAGDSLAKALPLLCSPLEAAALRERRLGGFAAIDRLRGRQTDAAFVIARIAALPGNDATREAIYDAINPSCELLPGRRGSNTPSRTHDRLPAAPRAYRRTPPVRERADLRAALKRAPQSIRRLSPRAGAVVLDLARRVLVPRQRDLEAFSLGNPRDVWLVDDGGGLAFALIGVLPARRPPVAAIYGTLYLQNGVPIGYGQSDHVGVACALSFNLFDTFRGGEASRVLARLLAALHAVFGAASFSVEPYQIGQGNDEGITSGAWWFWFKHGFRPRAAAARELARVEQRRSARSLQYRSSEAALRRLAQWHLFFECNPAGPTPLPPLADLGLRVAALLAKTHVDRDAAIDASVREAQRRCGLASTSSLSATQHAAWRHWGPLLMLLPRLARWPAADKRALLKVIAMKAAASEREYVLRLAAHVRLRRELLGDAGARFPPQAGMRGGTTWLIPPDGSDGQR